MCQHPHAHSEPKNRQALQASSMPADIPNQLSQVHGLALLRQALGEQANFRADQWQVLDQLINHRASMLLIQPTGWGKSIIYFLACYWLRQQAKGPTLLVSPLLALMRNQALLAKRFALRVACLNSQNPMAKTELLANPDLVIATPESLHSPYMQSWLARWGAELPLVVIDEAHCVSEWGHQFRPDYRRLGHLSAYLGPHCLWLATTATASERIEQDIFQQLPVRQVVRGSLKRSELGLFNYPCQTWAERWHWLLYWLQRVPGAGLIYCLTTESCTKLASALEARGYAVAAYHAQLPNREQLEQQLLANELDYLVCTNALGMGFDKPDLRLVVHWQAPASLAAYYQQVGRAGRDGHRAYGVLLTGPQDQGLQLFFQQLSQQDSEHINRIIHMQAEQSLSPLDLAQALNIGVKDCQRLLKIMAQQCKTGVKNPSLHWPRINRNGGQISNNVSYFKGLNEFKQQSWREVERFAQAEDCLQRHLLQALGEFRPKAKSEPCGLCQHCLAAKGEHLESLPISVDKIIDPSELSKALRARPVNPCQKPEFQHFRRYAWLNSRSGFRASLKGLRLSAMQQSWLSKLFANQEDLPQVLVQMLLQEQAWLVQAGVQWVSYLPLGRQDELWQGLSQRLAMALALPWVEAFRLEKLQAPNPSFAQLDGAWTVLNSRPGRLLLILPQDLAGRALPLAASLLARVGCSGVVPFIMLSTAELEQSP